MSMRPRHALVLLVLLSAACRGREPTSPPNPAPAVAEAPGSGVAADDGSDGSAATAASPAAGAQPAIDPAAQACAVASDCRVFQPGDWNADVECCYAYGCDLDYVAVNRATWDELRAWRARNPFDCAERGRIEGPCAARAATCGLSQEPPPAACVDGICRVAWPPTWPIVDGGAQACTLPEDCVAWRPSSSRPEARCCNDDCRDDWVAINRATARELERWRGAHAPDCAAWLGGATCPPSPTCQLVAPATTCAAGLCALSP